MADKSLTPEQTEALLRYAGQRLGATPEQLKAAFQQQGLSGLSHLADQAAADDRLTPEAAAKARAVLQDKEKLQALMKDPSVQKLLAQLLG